jgi:spermidine/putrescine transport system permease protein
VRSRPRAAATPYLLALPSGLWLAIFFVVPLVAMFSLSLQTGNLLDGFRQTFNLGVYVEGVRQYHTQIARSLLYGLAATLACLVLAFPMAYWIAFRGGRYKNAYLLLILLPFFVSFVLRTFSWNFLLADQGMVLGPLKSAGLLPADFHVLATGVAVVAGLTYNFLPFMVLPIYVALERIEPALVEAARDLYASRRQAFARVVLPLSLPGVFAGVLMVFVPASSDFVNAQILGGTDNVMIGNIIQTEFFVNSDYPMASALSFVLMALLLAGIFGYARTLGTENVLEAGAAGGAGTR